MANKIIIHRDYKRKVTKGDAWVENKIGVPIFDFKTIELPWMDNQIQVSCVPEGIYTWQKYQSPKFGEVILLNNIDNRSMIEIHAGNFTYEIKGCILPGDEHEDINADGIIDVKNSRKTLKKLLSILDFSGTIEIIS